jgi:hypothetical protein
MPIANFDKVELLLPMTGANNGTVFTDYSLRQRTVTRTGAVTSTAQSKFAAYGSSGFFNGTTDYLSVANANGFDFSDRTFTVETWVRLASNNSARIASRSVGANNTDRQWVFFTNSSGNLVFIGYTTGGGSEFAASTGAVATGAWVHVAASCDSGSLRLFINGTQDGTQTLTSLRAQVAALEVGSLQSISRSYLSGYMQDFCITKGAAKYTANFTPPERMTQRELTRTNTGTDSHEFDRAVLFDFNGGAHVGRHTTVLPDSSGDFVADDLIDLEYGVAFIRDGCSPVCRGPVEVDADA